MFRYEPFHFILFFSFFCPLHSHVFSVCLCLQSRKNHPKPLHTLGHYRFDFYCLRFCYGSFLCPCVCVLSEILWTFTELMRIFNTFVLDKSIYFDIYRVNNDFKPRKMSIHSKECLILKKKSVCSFVCWFASERMHWNSITLSNATNPIQFHDCVCDSIELKQCVLDCSSVRKVQKKSKSPHTHMIMSSRITHIRPKRIAEHI